MVQYWLFAIGGGVVSASLYLSVVLGSSGAMLLAYLAQLPLFVAALGFGTLAGATASGAGTLVVALAGGMLAGLLYLLVNGLPVVLMSQRALLSRWRWRSASPASRRRSARFSPVASSGSPAPPPPMTASGWSSSSCRGSRPPWSAAGS